MIVEPDAKTAVETPVALTVIGDISVAPTVAVLLPMLSRRAPFTFATPVPAPVAVRTALMSLTLVLVPVPELATVRSKPRIADAVCVPAPEATAERRLDTRRTADAVPDPAPVVVRNTVRLNVAVPAVDPCPEPEAFR